MKRLQLKYIVYTEAYLNAAILVSLFALVKHCVSQSFRSKVRSCDRANDLIVAIHDRQKPHSYTSKELIGSLHSTVKKTNEIQQLTMCPAKKRNQSLTTTEEDSWMVNGAVLAYGLKSTKHSLSSSLKRKCFANGG